DEETGEAAYQLQGGRSGGVTAPSVVTFPQELVDALAEPGSEPPVSDSGAVAHIAKAPITDFQEGTVAKPLPRPLRVVVTDVDGYVVKGATVTFVATGGGGVFVDPATGRLIGSGVVTTVSNARGEAEAKLVLGKRTDLIPRFVCEEGR